MEEESVGRALAWPGFVAPKERVEEAAGLPFHVRQLRHRLLVGLDNGAWLPPSLLRKVPPPLRLVSPAASCVPCPRMGGVTVLAFS